MTTQPRSFSPESPHEETIADIIQFPSRSELEHHRTDITPETNAFNEAVTTHLLAFQDNIRKVEHVTWPKELRASLLDITLNLEEGNEKAFVLVHDTTAKSDDELWSLGTSRERANDIIAISRKGDLYAKTYYIDQVSSRSNSLPWEEIKPGDIHEQHLPSVDTFLNMSIDCSAFTMRTLQAHIEYITAERDPDFW